MTIPQMIAWAEEVDGYSKAQVHQAWQDLLLHRRHVSIRRAA
jgi:hypothetical protein